MFTYPHHSGQPYFLLVLGGQGYIVLTADPPIPITVLYPEDAYSVPVTLTDTYSLETTSTDIFNIPITPTDTYSK